MHIPFEDFERVMTQCFEVFSCWDDEYEKLQGLLRYVNKLISTKMKERKKYKFKIYFIYDINWKCFTVAVLSFLLILFFMSHV